MKVQEFASLLFDIEINSHIAHTQTDKYSDHEALNSLYKDIVELRDRFIESYQGKYEIITGYKITLQEGVEIIPYLKECLKLVEEYRLTLEDGFLQQISDDIIELLASTLYKLRFLKK
jgi:hypothetical protein